MTAHFAIFNLHWALGIGYFSVSRGSPALWAGAKRGDYSRSLFLHHAEADIAAEESAFEVNLVASRIRLRLSFRQILA